MPGLWDMHSHVSGVNAGLLYIASGITTVRDLANDRDALLALIKGYESGADIGPRVVRAGFVDGRSPYSGPTKVFADNDDEARADVAQFVKDGFVQVKVYSSLKPELVPVFAKLAHENGMRLSGHVPNGMSAQQFVEAGADEIQHANFLLLNFLADASVDTRTPARFSVVADRALEVDLDGKPMHDFIDVLLQHHTVIDPTLVTFEGMFLDRPGKMGPTWYDVVGRLPVTWQRGIRASTGGLEVTPQNDLVHRQSYQHLIDMVGLMYRSGVTVVAGTDDSPPFSLPRELELYTHAGIPPAEVLRIATLGAAKVMKRDDAYGRIAPGYAADLILIDGDPTRLITDVRRVRTVVRGDRWFEAGKLYEAVGIAP
jgi:imidazolonepropionase-like amidohydrolase